MDIGVNNRICKFAHNTNIGYFVLTDKDQQSLQEVLHLISAWPDRREVPVNVNKCHVLHVGTRNKKFDYEMDSVKLENVQCVKILGVNIASNLELSLQCIDAANKKSKMLGFINWNFLFKIKDVIRLPYNRLVRPLLEYAVQFWSLHHTKDIAKLEG